MSGELYYAGGPELLQGRTHAKKVLRVYNESDDDGWEEREKILRGLLGSVGRNPFIEPPFRCVCTFCVCVYADWA